MNPITEETNWRVENFCLLASVLRYTFEKIVACSSTTTAQTEESNLQVTSDSLMHNFL